MKKSTKLSKISMLTALTALLIMLGSQAAQAYTTNRFFTGFSYANQYWSSGPAVTSYGGSSYVGTGSIWGSANTSYIATYDKSTGYWIASGAAGSDTWSQLNHLAYYPAFNQCWWNSNYDNPGQPQLLCNQYKG